MVRPSDPRPPIPDRDTSVLLDDLGLALRDVGVGARGFGAEAIREVQEIDGELRRRDVDLADRLASLSNETGWLMDELLRQCREYPSVMPSVRLLNGLRKDQLCFGCGEQERPDDPTRFLVCNRCLQAMIRAIEERVPLPQMLLFRTYSRDARCEHAGDDTVLVVYPWWEAEAGVCVECLRAELAGRAS